MRVDASSVRITANFYDEEITVDRAPGESLVILGGWNDDFSTRTTSSLIVGNEAIPDSTVIRSLIVAGGTLIIN